MVTRALTICLFFWAATAMAQESAVPPAVESRAPTLGAGSQEVEAMPTLPSSGAEIAAVPEGAKVKLGSLVLKAHPVVQGVMGLLGLALLAVLTIFLFKLVEIWLVFARLRRARIALAAHGGLPDIPGDCPLALAARAARGEAEAVPHHLTADLRASARERLELALDRIEAGAVLRLRSGTGLLASIGAVGPFVGLFGTVFGIMNSFLAIAASKTTSLVVVAPGIAEALLATGIGLVAAIPAVLLYNAILRRVAAFRHGFADGRADLLARFSRSLDQRMEA